MAADASNDPHQYTELGRDGQTLQPVEVDSQRVDLEPSPSSPVSLVQVDSDVEIASPVVPRTKVEKMYNMANAKTSFWLWYIREKE